MVRPYILLIVFIISLNCYVQCLISYDILNSTKCSNYCNNTSENNAVEVIFKAYLNTSITSDNVHNVLLEISKPKSNSSEKMCFLNGCKLPKDAICYCKNATSDLYNSSFIFEANVNLSCLYSQGQITLVIKFFNDSKQYIEQTQLPDLFTGEIQPHITTSLKVNGNIVDENNCTVEVPNTQVTIEYSCSNVTVTPCYLKLVDVTRNVTITSSEIGRVRLKHNYREKSYVRFLLQKNGCETIDERKIVFECIVRTGSNWEEDVVYLKATFLLFLIGTAILLTAGLCQYRQQLFHRFKEYNLVNQVPNRRDV